MASSPSPPLSVHPSLVDAHAGELSRYSPAELQYIEVRSAGAPKPFYFCALCAQSIIQTTLMLSRHLNSIPHQQKLPRLLKVYTTLTLRWGGGLTRGLQLGHLPALNVTSFWDGVIKALRAEQQAATRVCSLAKGTLKHSNLQATADLRLDAPVELLTPTMLQLGYLLPNGQKLPLESEHDLLGGLQTAQRSAQQLMELKLDVSDWNEHLRQAGWPPADEEEEDLQLEMGGDEPFDSSIVVTKTPVPVPVEQRPAPVPSPLPAVPLLAVVSRMPFISNAPVHCATLPPQALSAVNSFLGRPQVVPFPAQASDLASMPVALPLPPVAEQSFADVVAMAEKECRKALSTCLSAELLYIEMRSSAGLPFLHCLPCAVDLPSIGLRSHLADPAHMKRLQELGLMFGLISLFEGPVSFTLQVGPLPSQSFAAFFRALLRAMKAEQGRAAEMVQRNGASPAGGGSRASRHSQYVAALKLEPPALMELLHPALLHMRCSIGSSDMSLASDEDFTTALRAARESGTVTAGLPTLHLAVRDWNFTMQRMGRKHAQVSAQHAVKRIAAKSGAAVPAAVAGAAKATQQDAQKNAVRAPKPISALQAMPMAVAQSHPAAALISGGYAGSSLNTRPSSMYAASQQQGVQTYAHAFASSLQPSGYAVAASASSLPAHSAMADSNASWLHYGQVAEEQLLDPAALAALDELIWSGYEHGEAGASAEDDYDDGEAASLAVAERALLEDDEEETDFSAQLSQFKFQ